MSIEEKRRAAFERWAEDQGLNTKRDGVVVAYAYRHTDNAWQAWNAALDSVVVDLPKRFAEAAPYACYENGWNDMHEEAVDAIEAAGLKVAP